MQTVTNNLRKQVRQLAQAKHRRELGLFCAEGTKCVLDTLGAFSVDTLIATRAWLDAHPDTGVDDGRIALATAADLERMTSLTTAPQVIAVYKIPDNKPDISALAGKLTVALDRVQDPGNLGTIMRVCDWMGVRTILASNDTVDLYNPKVVQATMGSISRVKVYYTHLPATLLELRSAGMPVYGTFLDGKDIYTTPLTAEGVIVMGNEGNGVSDAVAAAVTHRLYIPPYPPQSVTAESLNVSMATAITLAEFRRRIIAPGI